MIRSEKLPPVSNRSRSTPFNDSQQLKSLLNEKLPTSRPKSLHLKPTGRDPSIQSNSYWVEKSARLINFVHSSSVKYNIINHASNNSLYIKNVANVKNVSHRKKAIAEFCDYDRISAPNVNQTYQVRLLGFIEKESSCV